MSDKKERRYRLYVARARLHDVRFHLEPLALTVDDELIVGHIVSALASTRQAIRRVDQAIDDLEPDRMTPDKRGRFWCR